MVSDLNTIFTSYIKALNEHRTEDILAFYAEDFVFKNTEGHFSYDKRSELNDAYEWNKEANSHFVADSTAISEPKIETMLTESSDFLSLLDVANLKTETTFIFENGLIKEHTASYVNHDPNFAINVKLVCEWAGSSSDQRI